MEHTFRRHAFVTLLKCAKAVSLFQTEDNIFELGPRESDKELKKQPPSQAKNEHSTFLACEPLLLSRRTVAAELCGEDKLTAAETLFRRMLSYSEDLEYSMSTVRDFQRDLILAAMARKAVAILTAMKYIFWVMEMDTVGRDGTQLMSNINTLSTLGSASARAAY
ncbi:unnamed protein product [Haemonchus placei]|uniref:NR LBD domain-containing protein n=1 Tax=Haemonchus placei TaxID=6290 RepID=A0A0N4W8Y1_HAEPC|nr:unnamed protein product [Haemonchus placei]